MAKNIPAAEFKAAVKLINKVLKENEEEPIKIVGVKKEDVVEKFTKIVMNFIDEDRSDELPDEVIELYNTYIAVEDEDEEEQGTEEAAPKTKTKTKGKGKGKPAAKEKKEKKAKTPKEKKPGIVMLAIKAYMEDGCKSADEIIKHIQSNFPDRNISKTVSHCFGVLGK